MTLLTPLKPFQREGVAAFHTFGGRVLCADDLGLGKTIETLAYLDELDVYPRLVVCPAYLKNHWRREAWNHCRMRTELLSGRTPYDTDRLRYEADAGTLLVINYDVLENWLPFLLSLEAKIIVTDEVQMVGNCGALRTGYWLRLCRPAPHLICLSATPLKNNHFELFPALSVLCPWVEDFSSPFAFGLKFCEPTNRFGRWQFPGARRGAELHRLLVENCMVRRTKAEVAPDLPPRRVIVVPLEIEGRKEYREAERDVIGWLAKTDVAAARRAARAECFVRFTHLKRLAARKKAPRVLDWLDNFVNHTDGKLLIGGVHLDWIDRMYQRYKSVAVTITGAKSAKQRQEAEDKVRQDLNCRLLIGQIKACGLGLNLPELNTVATTELLLTPGDHQQFDGRSHRLTSTLPVDSYYFTGEDTIEEELCKILTRKQKILNQALDGDPHQEGSLNLLDELRAAMLRKRGPR